MPNSSMEEHPEICQPEQYLEGVYDWFVPPEGGTTDYMNSCYNEGDGIGVPVNNHGFEFAHTGEAYIAFGTWQNAQAIDGELMRVELLSPLEWGSVYEVSFWLSLAETSSVSTDKVFCHFTQEDYSVENSAQYELIDECQVVLDIKNQVPFVGWQEFSGCFLAEGNEQFVTLGDFRPFYDVDTTWVGSNDEFLLFAIYYIDDVSVRKLSSCRADFNVDQAINVMDLLVLLTEFGCVDQCELDLTCDGKVDVQDLLYFLSAFGQWCVSVSCPEIG